MGTTTVCPAATIVHPPADRVSVVCGALALANRGAAIEGYTSRGYVNPVLSGEKSADIIAQVCTGCGIPGSRAQTYTACKIWQAEKKRIAAQRAAGADGLRDDEAIVQGKNRPDRSELHRIIAKTRGELV